MATQPASVMRHSRGRSFLVCLGALLLVLIAVSGCGGGSQANSAPPSPSFTINASPSSISISTNTKAQVGLALVPENGFSGTVIVSVSGLPSGVTTSPDSPFTLPAAGTTLTITAGANVADGTYPLTLQATSGSLSSRVPVSLTIQPLASFSLSLPFSSLVVTQGGSLSGIFNLSTGAGATNYSVTLSATGLPAGVTASFAQNPLPAYVNQSSVIFTATSTAMLDQNVTAQLTATRTSDGAVASANFAFTVAPPPGSLPGNRTNFVATYNTPSSIIFDSVHKLIYAALPDLAAVDVIDPSTAQVVRQVLVPDATGLSLSPDGSRILVTGATQQVAWIDTSSQQIVQRSILPSCTCSTQFVSPGSPMIMANGDVLLSGLLEWNPTTRQLTQLSPTNFSAGQDTIGVRAEDGTLALFSTDTLPTTIGVYSSVTNGFTATLTYRDNAYALAASPNDNQFAVAVKLEGVFFLDGQLNTLGQAPVDGLITGMQYSPDGSELYIVSTIGNQPLISTIDTMTFQLIGQAPAYASNIAYVRREPPLIVETPMASDSTGMLYGAGDHGVALDDTTFFQNILTSDSADLAIIATPAEGPQTASTQVTISTQAFSSVPNVWFGNLNGLNPSLNNGGVQATAPPSSEAGPVDVKIISPNGTEGNIPDGFTYGAVSVPSPILAAPPSGAVTADFFGYGYSSDLTNTTTQVQINGQSAPIVESVLFPAEYSFGYPFPVDHVRITVPPGAPGATNVSVTSPAGTATLPDGLHYVQNVQEITSTDTFSFVLYDPSRQQLYLDTGDHIDVFSLSSDSFLTSVTPPSITGKRQIVWLALTPDDSRLLAANAVDGSVAIINPDNPSAATVAPIVSPGNVGPSSVAATSTGLAFVSTAMADVDLGGNLNVYQLNLSTLQVSPVTIQGFNEFLGLPATVVAASNGSTVLGYINSGQGGGMYAWTAATGMWTTEHAAGGSDATVSGDGNVMATDVTGGMDFVSTVVDCFDPSTNFLSHTGLPQYLDAVPAVSGMKLNLAGSLVYVPVTLSIPTGGARSSESAVDIYDVRRNQLRERVLLTQQFPVPTGLPNAMAVDSTGQKVFLITKTGLTIVTLDVVPLSIGYVTPNTGAAGTTITVRGSGFTQATAATFNGTAATVTFVDANTLQATVPASLSSGSVSVTLTNPDRSTYTLENVFTVN
ncbi:MAG TPA: IPT/TIG domain-containing protein [Candidatus Acidoferrales bacterium]|nr:IPT/TIG domain-containing protein [Candidatus Acidoferrales bacterium]